MSYTNYNNSFTHFPIECYSHSVCTINPVFRFSKLFVEIYIYNIIFEYYSCLMIKISRHFEISVFLDVSYTLSNTYIYIYIYGISSSRK